MSRIVVVSEAGDKKIAIPFANLAAALPKYKELAAAAIGYYLAEDYFDAEEASTQLTELSGLKADDPDFKNWDFCNVFLVEEGCIGIWSAGFNYAGPQDFCPAATSYYMTQKVASGTPVEAWDVTGKLKNLLQQALPCVEHYGSSELKAEIKEVLDE